MPILNAATLAEWAGGYVAGDETLPASGMVADSRAQMHGSAFAAVRGERVDGHDFVDEALSRGAPFVVVERTNTLPAGATAVVVDDTVAALGAMAAAARGQMSARVVGITGSTGKTLTKDLVSAALATSLRVHAAPASFNTDVTVPLVVLGAPDDTDVIVAELGARRTGEIERLCRIVRPDIGVVTGIGSTHLELFGTRDAIARTKSELLSSLPADGLGVVPSNDDFLATFSSSTSARLVCVGPGGAVTYTADRIAADGRTHGRISIDGGEVAVVLPVPGRPLLRNAALAIRVAVEFGIDPATAAASLTDAELSALRLQLLEIGGRTIVNDAYNANPTSVAATLRSAKELASGREIWAVLGRMAELGPVSEAEHRRIGRLVRVLGYNGVLVVGEGAEAIAAAAGSLATHVGSIEQAADAVRSLVGSNTVLVVKASRAVGLERLVDELSSAAQTSTSPQVS